MFGGSGPASVAGNKLNAMSGQKKVGNPWASSQKTGQLHEPAYGVLSAAGRTCPTQMSIIQDTLRRVMGIIMGMENLLYAEGHKKMKTSNLTERRQRSKMFMVCRNPCRGP